MRKELLYNPLLLLERLGKWATDTRRIRSLRGTPASVLTIGHIDSLELLQLLKTRDIKVIFDIGANIGTWTLLAKSVLPNSEIHAFEPLRPHVDEFRKKTCFLSDVHLHECALGRESGIVDLRVSSFSDASSVLPMVKLGQETWGLEEVNIIRVPIESMDNIIRDRKVPNPDLIKLDIQGYELVALSGAIRALEHAKAVIVEVSFDTFYEKQCLFHDVVSFMAANHFYLVSIGGGFQFGSRLLQMDLLFEKKA